MTCKWKIYLVVAACVLHNICEVHNETFDDSWLASINDDALPQPQATNHDSGSVASGRPKEIQEALVNFFICIHCSVYVMLMMLVTTVHLLRMVDTVERVEDMMVMEMTVWKCYCQLLVLLTTTFA